MHFKNNKIYENKFQMFLFSRCALCAKALFGIMTHAHLPKLKNPNDESSRRWREEQKYRKKNRFCLVVLYWLLRYFPLTLEDEFSLFHARKKTRYFIQKQLNTFVVCVLFVHLPSPSSSSSSSSSFHFVSFHFID